MEELLWYSAPPEKCGGGQKDIMRGGDAKRRPMGHQVQLAPNGTLLTRRLAAAIRAGGPHWCAVCARSIGTAAEHGRGSVGVRKSGRP